MESMLLLPTPNSRDVRTAERHFFWQDRLNSFLELLCWGLRLSGHIYAPPASFQMITWLCLFLNAPHFLREDEQDQPRPISRLNRKFTNHLWTHHLLFVILY
jgi:hypothetical protein